MKLIEFKGEASFDQAEEPKKVGETNCSSDESSRIKNINMNKLKTIDALEEWEMVTHKKRTLKMHFK